MSINIKLSNKKKIKVTIIKEAFVTQTLGELYDVDAIAKRDKYALMYNDPNEKWKAVNPDEIISASLATETTEPGLPQNFINTLYTDLDGKIGLDGGTW
jgi:hypothetical protein